MCVLLVVLCKNDSGELRRVVSSPEGQAVSVGMCCTVLEAYVGKLSETECLLILWDLAI